MIEQTETQPARDRFDCLCDCVLIELTRDDERRFLTPGRHPEDYQLFKRKMVNAGRREVVSADGDCQACQGSGWAHEPPALPAAYA